MIKTNVDILKCRDFMLYRKAMTYTGTTSELQEKCLYNLYGLTDI